MGSSMLTWPRLYWVLLMTFVRRPWIWIGLGIAAGPYVFLRRGIGHLRAPVSVAPWRPDTFSVEAMFVLAILLACACACSAAAVTAHAAQILAAPRNRVVPRLRGAVLAVTIVLTACVVAGPVLAWPSPTFGAGRVDLALRLPVVAFVALIAGQLAFAQFAPVVGSLSCFAWGALALPGAEGAVRRMLVGGEPVLAWTMGAVAASLFVATWTWMAVSRDRWYAKDPVAETITWAWRRLGRRSRGGAAQPTFMGSAAGKPRADARAVRRLRRLVAWGGADASLVGIVFGGVGASWLLIASSVQLGDGGKVDPKFAQVLCFVVSVLSVAITQTAVFEQRRPLLGHGLMLPRSRATFIGELGLTVLGNQLRMWVCALAPLLAAVLWAAPAAERPTPRMLAAVLAVGLAYQLFAFGLIVWLVRADNPFMAVFGLFPVCVFSVVTIALPGDTGRPRAAWVEFGGAAVLAVAGAALALGAYRRWVEAEPAWAGRARA